MVTYLRKRYRSRVSNHWVTHYTCMQCGTSHLQTVQENILSRVTLATYRKFTQHIATRFPLCHCNPRTQDCSLILGGGFRAVLFVCLGFCCSFCLFVCCVCCGFLWVFSGSYVTSYSRDVHAVGRSKTLHPLYRALYTVFNLMNFYYIIVYHTPYPITDVISVLRFS